MRARLGWLGLALVACGASGAPGRSPPLPSVDVAPAPGDQHDDSLTSELGRCAVSDAQPAHRVYFSWTTREQAAELARRRVLLTRSVSPTRGPSKFDVLLAEDDSPTAQFIRTHLTTRRFGWPHAWATAAGWEGETYGDQLIRIELADEAMVARFRPGRHPAWAFFDVDGRSIPEPKALAQLERLAVVHHTGSFREAVIVNEAMIARWQLATPEVARELRRGVELLRTLERRLTGERADARLRAQWTACLAFTNDRYRLDSASLRRIRAGLEAAVDAQGPRLEHHPLGQRPSSDPRFAQPPPPRAPGGPVRWCGTMPCP